MKFRWDKKYLHWGVTAFCVLAAAMLFYFGLFHMDTLVHGFGVISAILMPILYGCLFAYLLDPMSRFMENEIIFRVINTAGWKPKKKGRTVIRIVCTVLSLLMAILLIYGLLAMLLPQLFNSITNIVVNFPRYADNIQKWITNLFKNYPDLEQYTNDLFDRYSMRAENWMSTQLLPQMKNLVQDFSSRVYDVFVFFKNIFIGIVIAIYIMVSKERYTAHGKRMLYSMVSPPTGNRILKNLRFINDTFSGFIVGKVIDSIIIGFICYLGTSLIGTPYALLVSAIIGVTNVIPFFGPYLGAIPCAILILLISPIQSLYFIIFILVLQQFDGNVLGPRILGQSTGLSSFMVIVAILIGGGIFGIFGMFVGVPVCAVICALASEHMRKTLDRKNLPENLEVYRDMDYMDPETKACVPLVKEKKKINFHLRVDEKKDS